jgi:ATP-dependent helicase/nuclease subunit B
MRRRRTMALRDQTAYNAGMGSISAAEIDAHLCAGGTVVAASDRAARAVAAAFHRARRAQGREAWAAPGILDWQTFVRLAWEERASDARLILNLVQEQSLWDRIVAETGHSASLLESPRRNLAAMAMQAHGLLCSYAPQFLQAKSRASWEQDAAAFNRWLSSFESLCRDNDVVSPNRLALELIPLLESDPAPRPALLLVGFDRLLPVHEAVFNAWGRWTSISPDEAARSVRSFAAPDQASEVSTCAYWCSERLRAYPQSTILIVTHDVRQRRGEFERAFLHQAASNTDFRFEFSLGIPLAQARPVRSAQMLLRWLDGELGEHELDWLFSTNYAITAAESAALQSSMRALRKRGMQRTQWRLRTFLDQRVTSSPLPTSWVQCMNEAHKLLQDTVERELTPLDWAEFVPQVLETMGWSVANAATSAEFQVKRRWGQVLESCGSLAFDGRRLRWQDFLSELLRTTDETLFAPESQDAPILIAGPAESAGLTADAVWFLGGDEDAWPARGDAHPLLPIDVQRRARMPHSSAHLDWDLAHSITRRIAASAPEVHFSFAHQRDGVEMRPSRLVAEIAGAAQPIPAELMPGAGAPDFSIMVEDFAAIPYGAAATEGGTSIHLRGGAGLLTAQSQCPFKAFATGRLGASTWDPAETSLTAAERGQLLHAVLHSIWKGPPQGIRSSRDLQNISDLQTFVARHVQIVIATKAPPRAREDMPPRYLELEATRLTRLIAEWLAYERTRVDFEVVGTEIDKTRTIAGLSLDLRLDRLDRLQDGSLLVLDYKTGDVSPNSWDLPRSEDVQLPLYASFGLDDGEAVGGLTFAKVRAGDMCFAGRVGDAAATLDSTLKATSSLVKHPMTLEDVLTWREAIEQLARDFLAGRSDVDPRDATKTCERCGLQVLCRIQERAPLIDDPEAEVAHD